MTNANLGPKKTPLKGANSKTSSAGAHGQMQIEPGTFAKWAQPGESIDNPDDNKRVGQRIITGYANNYGNDPARVATAYFSGPGNVAPVGSPTPWIRNSSDGKTSVSQYVDQVLGRLSGKQGVSGAGQTPASAAPGTAGPAIGSGLADPRAFAKLALLRMAYPQFHFQSVEYDPWEIQRYAMRGGAT